MLQEQPFGDVFGYDIEERDPAACSMNLEKVGRAHARILLWRRRQRTTSCEPRGVGKAAGFNLKRPSEDEMSCMPPVTSSTCGISYYKSMSLGRVRKLATYNIRNLVLLGIHVSVCA